MVTIPSGIRVPPLRPGGSLAVVAPASAPIESSDVAAGMTRLGDMGFTLVAFFDPENREGYLSDSDTRRAAYLNEAFASDTVQAIMCVRGGYGSLRILDLLDFESLARRPKIIVGYSDITALHFAVLKRTGIPGLSAAMLATDWKDIDPLEARSVVACLTGTASDGLFAGGGLELRPEKSGSVEGRCIGGNLSVIGKLIGTPYLPDLTDAVLFVEEVGEPPYRIDGLLAQLKLAGILDRIGGLVFGGITDAKAEDGKPSLTLDEVIGHYTDHVRGPVASGLPYGHFQPKVPIPVGPRVRLTVDSAGATLEALEQLVAI